MKLLSELSLYDGEIPKKPDEPISHRDYLLKPNVSPYLVYIILKEKFGPPNSDKIDEDKQQWEWLFSYKDFYILIYDWKLLSTSIAVYHTSSDEHKSKQLAEKINSLIEKEATHKKGKIKSMIREAKHKLLENPFVTYYTAATSLLEYAKFIDEITVHTHRLKNDGSELKISESLAVGLSLWEKKYDLYKSAFLMLLSSFEGFLNILYELYLHPELREDRIFTRIGREQIDIKLRMAPIYCDGFKVETIDHEDSRFKNYLRLINLRNDFVHANLVKRLERYIHEEDDFTFIIENEDSSDIPTNFNELQLEHVELAKKYIDEVVELVLESMKTKTKREFKNIIFEGEIEVEDEDGILIPRY